MIEILDKYASDLRAAFALEEELGQFQYLIDLGKGNPSFSEGERCQQNKMFGCLAQVWIISDKFERKNFFRGDSDAYIVKGLVSIITEALSGHTTDEIRKFEHNVVAKLGLGPGLTARRQVGMMAMIDHIKNITGAKQISE